MKVQLVFNGNKADLLEKLSFIKEGWKEIKEAENNPESHAHHQYWNYFNLIERIENMSTNAYVLRDYYAGSYCKLYFNDDKVVMYGKGTRGALQQNGDIFRVMSKLSKMDDRCDISMLKTLTPEIYIDEWYDSNKDANEVLLDRIKYRLWKEDVVIKTLVAISGGYPYYISDFKTALSKDDDNWDILIHSELDLMGINRDIPPTPEQARLIIHRPANWGRLVYLLGQGKSFDERPYISSDDD